MKDNKEKNIPEPVNYDFTEPIFDDESDEGWDGVTYLHKTRLTILINTEQSLIQEFDERLWGGLAEFVTAERGKEITVTFKDGTEIMA